MERKRALRVTVAVMTFVMDMIFPRFPISYLQHALRPDSHSHPPDSHSHPHANLIFDLHELRPRTAGY